MPRPKPFEFKRRENRHANTIPVAEWMEVRGFLDQGRQTAEDKQIDAIQSHILNHANRGGNRMSSEQGRQLAEEIFERRHELLHD